MKERQKVSREDRATDQGQVVNSEKDCETVRMRQRETERMGESDIERHIEGKTEGDREGKRERVRETE